MQIQKRGDVLIISPDPGEKDWFNEEFPDDFMKTSKHFKTKNFTERFGTATDNRYLEIRGKRSSGVKVAEQQDQVSNA